MSTRQRFVTFFTVFGLVICGAYFVSAENIEQGEEPWRVNIQVNRLT